MKEKNVRSIAQANTTKTNKTKKLKSKKILRKIDKIVSKIEVQVTRLLQVTQGLQKLRAKVVEEQLAA